MEKGATGGEKAGVGGSRGKEEQDRGAETPGEARARGHKGAGQREGPHWRGQGPTGKTTGRDEKWGKAQGRGGEGTDGGMSLGSGNKQGRKGGRGAGRGAAREAGAGSRQPELPQRRRKRRRREWRPSGERDRERELERAGEGHGVGRGRGRGQLPTGPYLLGHLPHGLDTRPVQVAIVLARLDELVRLDVLLHLLPGGHEVVVPAVYLVLPLGSSCICQEVTQSPEDLTTNPHLGRPVLQGLAVPVRAPLL